MFKCYIPKTTTNKDRPKTTRVLFCRENKDEEKTCGPRIEISEKLRLNTPRKPVLPASARGKPPKQTFSSEVLSTMPFRKGKNHTKQVDD